MPDKSLDRAERDLLAILQRLHAERGPVPRDVLSVEARGRGLEVSRPLQQLRALGLAEEVERRPFFLKRLFGARTVVLVRPTEAGLAAVEPAAAETPARPPEAPAAAVPAAAETIAEPPAAAPLAETTADALAPAPPTEAAREPAAPDAPAEAPVAEQAPVQAPAQAPAQARPKRLPLTAYTEELGGTPDAAPVRTAIDPEVMDGLRELLEVLGMEMTMAGEALVAERIAHGASSGDALSQVVLFAFAHAIRHDLLVEEELRSEGLVDYTVEVMRELEKLRDAGEIGEQRFEEDMRRLWALVQDTPERAGLAEALLADPIGGAAPPALLPEDLRPGESDDTEEDDWLP